MTDQEKIEELEQRVTFLELQSIKHLEFTNRISKVIEQLVQERKI